MASVIAETQAKLDMDGVQLRTVKRRFALINTDRLKRVGLALHDRQKQFLDILPLLFHVNHPMLPGYLTSKTPAGIADYKPSDRTLSSAKKFAKSFAFSRRMVGKTDIHALYLMGSSGTIAYSRKSDFDIWVCINPDLDEEERQSLARKAEGIETWAGTIGLEVHFFLMNDEAFRKGEVESLSTESSGSAQHHLLLDEFYRTSLLLAGRFPIWWLVPPEYEPQYDEYVAELKRRRFVNEHETVDFGGLGSMPVEEFFGATLWQLYKAVSSPYKSVLKILLMEAYAGEYPDIRMLSVRFKDAVYSGDANLDELDPYIQLLTRVEEYLLENGELDRLELARRCFYFKINEKMSRPDGRSISWRRELMREILAEWSWTEEHLKMLDSRAEWKIEKVMEERQTLVEALSDSYRALSGFAREHASEQAIDPAELNLLGRRLYAAFERKAGKVDIVNPGISQDLLEERLSLHQLRGNDQEGWVLFRGLVRTGETVGLRPIKRTHSLTEMLAWCHFNRLTSQYGSMITLHPEDCPISTWELRSITDCLEDIFPEGELAEPDMEALAQPEQVRQNALFINLGADPMAKLTREGMQLVSNRTDALSYGGRWENLVLNFEIITVTSWQEVLTSRYSGENTLMDCLCDYLAWSPLDGDHIPIPVTTFSFSSTRGAPIAKRVEEVFRNVINWYYKRPHAQHARYVLQVGHQFYVLQPENNVPRYENLKGQDALLSYLGQPQEAFSPVAFDAYTLSDSPLHLIYKINKPGKVQLFYQPDGAQATVYIIDERGSLFHQVVAYHDALTLLTQFQRFLDKVSHRRGFLIRELGFEDDVDGIEYYQIVHRPGSPARLERQNLSPFKQSRTYFGVQVIGDVLENNKTVFTMYCNEQEFSTLEHGDQLFTEVAKFVLSKRASGQTYPIYITDIDLARPLLGSDAGKGLQTVQFLNYKKRIEQRLNSALSKL